MKAEKTPWWETVILFASFALVWAWFLARQSKIGASVGWNAVLLIAVAALVLVLVRRIRRTVAALRAVEKRR